MERHAADQRSAELQQWSPSCCCCWSPSLQQHPQSAAATQSNAFLPPRSSAAALLLRAALHRLRCPTQPAEHLMQINTFRKPVHQRRQCSFNSTNKTFAYTAYTHWHIQMMGVCISACIFACRNARMLVYIRACTQKRLKMSSKNEQELTSSFGPGAPSRMRVASSGVAAASGSLGLLRMSSLNCLLNSIKCDQPLDNTMPK